MEYATRDQAQQAVAQLSNQNLMGRLVYVREVRWIVIRLGGCDIKLRSRIVRRSLGSSVPPALAVADMAVACLVTTQDTGPLLALAAAAAVEVAVAAVVRSTWLTFVHLCFACCSEWRVTDPCHSSLLTSAGKI